MKKPTVRIYTTADEFIDREMTDEEFAQHKIDRAEGQAELDKIEARAQAKLVAQAKLETLGLTVEDLQALGL
jgi:hypothetical protein